MDDLDNDQLNKTNDNLRKMEDATARLARSISVDLTGALQQAVFSSKSLSDVFKGLALGMSKDIFAASVKPLQNVATTAISSLISGFGAGVTPFAKGGVVQGATMFGAGGGLGVMGEAGAEAIMPLSRDASGRLGVNMQGGSAPMVNVTIQTANPESFRASTGQIKATLAKAVAQGQRRL